MPSARRSPARSRTSPMPACASPTVRWRRSPPAGCRSGPSGGCGFSPAILTSRPISQTRKLTVIGRGIGQPVPGVAGLRHRGRVLGRSRLARRRACGVLRLGAGRRAGAGRCGGRPARSGGGVGGGRGDGGVTRPDGGGRIARSDPARRRRRHLTGAPSGARSIASGAANAARCAAAPSGRQDRFQCGGEFFRGGVFLQQFRHDLAAPTAGSAARRISPAPSAGRTRW